MISWKQKQKNGMTEIMPFFAPLSGQHFHYDLSVQRLKAAVSRPTPPQTGSTLAQAPYHTVFFNSLQHIHGAAWLEPALTSDARGCITLVNLNDTDDCCLQSEQTVPAPDCSNHRPTPFIRNRKMLHQHKHQHQYDHRDQPCAHDTQPRDPRPAKSPAIRRGSRIIHIRKQAFCDTLKILQIAF